ncbi:MAG TPA: L-serine ammonia-lyase, iron-sulfur-dependent subunit beta [Longimicrobiales bacterium]|nr:L-serine ammonia-lyase, iron-sulfur-dependent subunit beta [Longimicrobiales bacterium]
MIFVSLFDILGPVMVGPSSSHTAGACRLGLMARAIFGGQPQHARIALHGSFAKTGEGHGTHRAIVGGLIGLAPDDLRLRQAYDEAKAAGLTWDFEEVDLGDEAHPNTAIFDLVRDDATVRVRGASIGGGRIEVTEIDEFPVSLSGSYDTLVVLARDEPGTIMTITGLCAAQGINLATMRVDRTGRRKDALMTIESDAHIPDAVLEDLREFDWLRWVRRVDRIA